jgi:hypothetical protein
MLCHLYFVQTNVLPSGFALVVPIGGCFATSLGWADALPPWFFFTLVDALPLGILVL